LFAATYRTYFASLRRRGAPHLALRILFFKNKQTGNNSGAVLLTIRSLTSWRGNAPFTIVAWPKRRSQDLRPLVEGAMSWTPRDHRRCRPRKAKPYPDRDREKRLPFYDPGSRFGKAWMTR
jgi:hypothetical protein